MPAPAPDILLCTLNARFIHAAFGLRYLLANLGELQPRAALVEFDLQQRPLDIVEALLQRSPRILGFGVYIWNARQTCDVLRVLRRLAPHVTVVLGGPEVSHETESQDIVALADHVITGEADLAFASLCRSILEGAPRPPKLIPATLPDPGALRLPYDLYSEADLAHRIVYVEASRGCPFSCEFCLSSLDVPVRQFPLPPFLDALQRLWDRGLRTFKFVDRTFNLDLRTSRAILRFFLDRLSPGLFLHFEMIPDRLPTELRELIGQFPPGVLQLEIGIQTFNPEVAARISRRQDATRTRENLQFLRTRTAAHLHVDLIAGLPGESLESFAAGFDQLVALDPHEIQVGILKRLRGTPIGRHDADWGMVYNPDPPYDILANSLIDFPAMQRLRRFARYWDLYANSGNFRESLPLLWAGHRSPFQAFLAFTQWIVQTEGRQHAIALDRLAQLWFKFGTTAGGLDAATCAAALAKDYARTRRDPPPFLRASPDAEGRTPRATRRSRAHSRQDRHRGDAPAGVG